MLLKDQTELWMSRLRIRKRKPVKPATFAVYGSHLKRWVLPHLGELDLANVDNRSARDFVAALAVEELSAATIRDIFIIVKQIVSSATDTNGNELYPRKWNHDFVDLPVVGRQRQPTLTTAQIEAILAGAKEPYRTLYVVLAGTGLRIGEALDIRIDGGEEQTTLDLSEKCIKVRTSRWRNKEQTPKTLAAIRDVDLAPELVTALAAFAKPAGFLFQSSVGTATHITTAYRALGEFKVPGFHVFRRYRTTYLRFCGVPEEIIRYWIGHADASITDRYSKMRERIDTRQEWAEKAGLGFTL